MTIDVKEWAVCQSAMAALRAAKIDFLLGGDFALATYTGKLRQPRHMAFFVLPGSVPAAIEAMAGAGFTDRQFVEPYDPSWIHRCARDGIVVDIVFGMANHRAEVDLLWFAQSRPTMLNGEPVKIIPPEEMVWQKLYVVRRDRCDWPDILDLLCVTGSTLDWNHLCNRVGEDLPLLRAVLNLNDWLCHQGCGVVPATVRDRLRLPPLTETPGPILHERRAALLDSRDWFSAC